MWSEFVPFIQTFQAILTDFIASVASPIVSVDAEFDENVCCDICRQVLCSLIFSFKHNEKFDFADDKNYEPYSSDLHTLAA